MKEIKNIAKTIYDDPENRRVVMTLMCALGCNIAIVTASQFYYKSDDELYSMCDKIHYLNDLVRSKKFEEVIERATAYVKLEPNNIFRFYQITPQYIDKLLNDPLKLINDRRIMPEIEDMIPWYRPINYADIDLYGNPNDIHKIMFDIAFHTWRYYDLTDIYNTKEYALHTIDDDKSMNINDYKWKYKVIVSDSEAQNSNNEDAVILLREAMRELPEENEDLKHMLDIKLGFKFLIAKDTKNGIPHCARLIDEITADSIPEVVVSSYYCMGCILEYDGQIKNARLCYQAALDKCKPINNEIFNLLEKNIEEFDTIYKIHL
ncbi:hypothetical protein RF11_10623 [Thelohanellus kitauei]|uniref:Tetratricopeptide repeat protein n=1 Tax=Thelohanellus kitauei TaxID=669202 RepID=A0A0C2MY29_THEKT|nr:hypothetical protein RF11_10623 [Thelohanellus kitauei]